MNTSYLKAVFEVQVVSEGAGRPRWRVPARGVVRVVDKQGRTVGLILGKEAAEDLEEEIAAAGPEFWDKIEESRRSGRVSSEEVKRRAGLI